MSAALTRRHALAASAAAALGIGAGVAPALAAPAAVPPVSAEAKALQAELARVSSEYRTACREADEASARVAYPDPPEALYERPGDRRLFLRDPEASWSDRADGRDWWAAPATVDRLRASTFRCLDGHACSLACARRDEIVTAFDAWALDDKAAEDAADYTAAQDRFEAAFYAYQALRVRLVELRTDDLEVLIVKALAIVDLCHRDPARLDLLIAHAAEKENGPREAALALSMVRDFVGLFGHSAWVAHA